MRGKKPMVPKFKEGISSEEGLSGSAGHAAAQSPQRHPSASSSVPQFVALSFIASPPSVKLKSINNGLCPLL